MDKHLVKLRKACFNRNYPLDQELIDMVTVEKAMQSHEFLRRPLTHYMHIYLVEYVWSFSKEWFGKEDIKALDWGCGKGQVSYLCRKRKIETVSCDIKRENDDSAFGQYTPIIEHEKMDIVPLTHPYVLPFEDRSFDVVLRFGVLEHVKNDAESMKEIHRILKPKGLFFCFFLPYAYSWRQHLEYAKGIYYHDHLYDLRKVKTLIEGSNMQLLDYWLRDMLPLKSHTPFFRLNERFDHWLCAYTFLKHLSANIEFVACKA